MRLLSCCAAYIICIGSANAQMGNSYITNDGLNRAPAVVLHCVSNGSVASPCGTPAQPLYVNGSSPLATAANQTSQSQIEQALLTVAGTQQDSPYTGGSGTTIALLKGIVATLAGGIPAIPVGGSFISRSTSLSAAQNTALFPTNAARRYLAFQVPAGTSVWLNFLGGTASPNGVDCVQFGAGTFYESGGFVPRGLVNVYTPVAVNISAWEG